MVRKPIAPMLQHSITPIFGGGFSTVAFNDLREWIDDLGNGRAQARRGTIGLGRGDGAITREVSSHSDRRCCSKILPITSALLPSPFYQRHGHA